jgi:hypothetical protein
MHCRRRHARGLSYCCVLLSLPYCCALARQHCSNCSCFDLPLSTLSVHVRGGLMDRAKRVIKFRTDGLNSKWSRRTVRANTGRWVSAVACIWALLVATASLPVIDGVDIVCDDLTECECSGDGDCRCGSVELCVCRNRGDCFCDNSTRCMVHNHDGDAWCQSCTQCSETFPSDGSTRLYSGGYCSHFDADSVDHPPAFICLAGLGLATLSFLFRRWKDSQLRDMSVRSPPPFMRCGKFSSPATATSLRLLFVAFVFFIAGGYHRRLP